MPSEISPIIFFGSRLNNEQRLLAFDLTRMLALSFHPGQNAAPVIAEINLQLKQLVRTVDVLNRKDRAHANINSIDVSEGNLRLDRRRFEAVLIHQGLLPVSIKPDFSVSPNIRFM